VNTLIAALERAIDGKMGAGDWNLLRAHVEKLRGAQEAWQWEPTGAITRARVKYSGTDAPDKGWRRVWIVEAT